MCAKLLNLIASEEITDSKEEQHNLEGLQSKYSSLTLINNEMYVFSSNGRKLIPLKQIQA